MTPSKKGPKPVPVKCPNCPKIFPAKWILKNHIIRRHEENGHVKCEVSFRHGILFELITSFQFFALL